MAAEPIPGQWRNDLERRLEGATEVHWARLTSQQWLPSSWMRSVCGGQHWGNGGNGPFYCAAGSLNFDVRETLQGDERQSLTLRSRHSGYIEIRPTSAINCCVSTDDIAPDDGLISPNAMGGCGPTVLVPGRSYLVVMSGERATFIGPVERAANPVLAAARLSAR
jgi:hypothetical protein